jgi:hypothetical protein
MMLNQGWEGGESRWRGAGEPIRTAEYEVDELHSDGVPKHFILAHHYLGSYPAARFRFGLYRREQLVGVAVFSHPCNDRVLTLAFPDASATASVELGRFVLLDEVPGNGETWFLGRCFESLRRRGLYGVVSFSDPVPRTRRDGSRVMPGHVGTIYQAHNGAYLGRGTARTLAILPDGRSFHARAASKIRATDRGWQSSATPLIEHGADPPWEDRAAWLRHWTDPARGIVRTLRHPGNHRYAWILHRRHRGRLPASLPYPKMEAMR